MIETKIRTLMIIPARSGSKGVVDKNIRPLQKQPLLDWTIATAQAVNREDCLLIISTDSRQYADLAESRGVAVPFLRPATLAEDKTGMVDVMLHALHWFETDFNYLPEQLMCLQPTSPFRRTEHIIKALDWMDEVDAVIACQAIDRDLTTLFFCHDNVMTAVNSKTDQQKRRQDIQPLLTPNGALYLCKTDWFKQHKNFYPPQTRPLIMNRICSLDIDTELDWKIAEAFIEQGLIHEN
jgi:N-acylneuraminate cytidylyltransferase/CMP-N,N'-diacetyllegionaminic acid synthase